MSRFTFHNTKLHGLKVAERQPIGDHRGFFERVFCTEELQILLENRLIQQINRTLTAQKGTLRGMHLQQSPHAEMKLVSCLRGEIFDVAIDLRKGSPTFLEWHGEVLSESNHRTLIIPEGFAHGFQTLCDNCELLYFHTAAFAPEAEAGVNPHDPRVAIDWPLPTTDISDRDTNHPLITTNFSGFEI